MNTQDIVNSMDRMPGNPDAAWIESIVSVAIKTGVLDLSVFVCPKFNTVALYSKQPEEYMPATADDPNDLFFQRIPKLKKVLADLKNTGVSPKLHILVGDNDAEVYIFPFMRGFNLNLAKFDKRRAAYLQSFEVRAGSLFSKDAEVQSLGLNNVVPGTSEAKVAEDELQSELVFFGWLFGETGPYKGNLKFDQQTLEEMVRLKFALYGAQGKFLQKIGGILLQTEGPKIWLQRTRMLRCTGATTVPAIYPWIRKEEM
ncbi:hypothetical protein KKC62_01705 [Patescibacteria group bacterium]|nr:hypothetical protein [Patescibacteria group bacterium]MBU1952906.1 hypothetical protein [Patescibacteria group bacterium]